MELAYNSNNWLFVQLLPFCLEAPGIRKLTAELSVIVFLYLQNLLCQPTAASSDVLLMNRWPVAVEGENILLVNFSEGKQSQLYRGAVELATWL